GEGVHASGKRDQVFITTKVTPENLHANDLERSAHESVRKLGVSAVHLFVLHWPNARVPLAATIGALNKVRRDGLAKHIGVSNFNVALIDEAVKLSDGPLACDQVEYHPFLDKSKAIAACKKHGMAGVGSRPCGEGG